MILNGKRYPYNYAKGYCKLHSCYLSGYDIKRKKCYCCKHFIDNRSEEYNRYYE